MGIKQEGSRTFCNLLGDDSRLSKEKDSVAKYKERQKEGEKIQEFLLN